MNPREPWAGWATSIGSLPHKDPDAATDFILRLHPEVPTAPQLPNRGNREAMIAQSLVGIDGVTIAEDGRTTVDLDRLTPLSDIEANFTEPYWSGYLSFLEKVHGRKGPFKFQLTGALTLTLALMSHQVNEKVAFGVAQRATLARAEALTALLAQHIPNAAVMVFIDEPALVTTAPDALPVDRRESVDALSEVLDVFGDSVVTGVHCCGPADWRFVLPAHPDVLSFPTGGDLSLNSWPLREHLRNGGCIAWGAVPSDRPLDLEEDEEALWEVLRTDWKQLIADGAEHEELVEQAIITPACGLAGLSVDDADLALTTTRNLATRLRDGSLRA